MIFFNRKRDGKETKFVQVYLCVFIHDEFDCSGSNVVDGFGSANGGVTQTLAGGLANIKYKLWKNELIKKCIFYKLQENIS